MGFATFMAEMRQSIVEGRFEAFRAHTHDIYPEKPGEDVAGQEEISGSKRASRSKNRGGHGGGSKRSRGGKGRRK